MIRHTKFLTTFIPRLFSKATRKLKLDDKKLWIEVPTIYMSIKEKQSCISNAVNILERNIKTK
jgi:hypothetical protein